MGLEYATYGTLGIIALLLLAWRFQSTRADTYGSADWLTIWEAYRSRLFRRNGLLVGGWPGARGFGIHYQGTHAVTFGASGSGKGTCTILPNLLSYPYIFLVDPGGENTAVAARHWRTRGYEFGCINVFGTQLRCFGRLLRAFPLSVLAVLFVRLPQDDAATIYRHQVKLERQAFSVLVIPGRPDAGPEGLLAALADAVGDERRGLGVAGLFLAAVAVTCRHFLLLFV